MIVDASAMVELLLQTRKAEGIETMLGSAAGLDAPHLVDAEVAHVLRRLVLRGDVHESRAGTALQAQADFPMRRHPLAPLLSRVWQWRNNLSAYDAVYVALAEALDTPLVTCDVRLGSAARGLAEVWVV